MLVFKRVLNLILSTSLAFAPSVAFARSPASIKKPKSGFKAVSKQAPAVSATSKKLADKKTAAKKKAEDLQFMFPRDVFSKMYPTVQASGGPVSVIDVPGVNGRVKTHMLTSKDYEEVMTDEFGNGTASKIFVRNGNVTVNASNPKNGMMTKIEVIERRKGVALRALYYMNQKASGYKLASFGATPYGRDNYDVTIGGAASLCANDLSGLSRFDSLMKEINATQPTSATSALECKLEKFQDFFIDSSCSTGEFAESIPYIRKAYAKILSSRRSDKSPGYLQCIEDRGFAAHAARIQTEFMKSYNQLSSFLSTNYNYPQSNSFDNDCKKVPVLSAKEMGPPYLEWLLSSSNNLRIQCDSKLKPAADYNSNGKVITLGATQKNVLKKVNEKSGSIEDAYAELIMHEMIHSTGISGAASSSDPFEKLTMDLGKCCASPDPSNAAHKTACDAVDIYTARAKAAAGFETQFTSMPGFTDLHAAIEGAGGGDRTDELLQSYYADMGSDPLISADREKISACRVGFRSSEPGFEACARPVVEEIAKRSDKLMNDQCNRFKNHTDFKVDCDVVKSATSRSILTGHPEPPSTDQKKAQAYARATESAKSHVFRSNGTSVKIGSAVVEKSQSSFDTLFAEIGTPVKATKVTVDMGNFGWLLPPPDKIDMTMKPAPVLVASGNLRYSPPAPQAATVATAVSASERNRTLLPVTAVPAASSAGSQTARPIAGVPAPTASADTETTNDDIIVTARSRGVPKGSTTPSLPSPTKPASPVAVAAPSSTNTAPAAPVQPASAARGGSISLGGDPDVARAPSQPVAGKADASGEVSAPSGQDPSRNSVADDSTSSTVANPAGNNFGPPMGSASSYGTRASTSAGNYNPTLGSPSSRSATPAVNFAAASLNAAGSAAMSALSSVLPKAEAMQRLPASAAPPQPAAPSSAPSVSFASAPSYQSQSSPSQTRNFRSSATSSNSSTLSASKDSDDDSDSTSKKSKSSKRSLTAKAGAPGANESDDESDASTGSSSGARSTASAAAQMSAPSIDPALRAQENARRERASSSPAAARYPTSDAIVQALIKDPAQMSRRIYLQDSEDLLFLRGVRVRMPQGRILGPQSAPQRCLVYDGRKFIDEDCSKKP